MRRSMAGVLQRSMAGVIQQNVNIPIPEPEPEPQVAPSQPRPQNVEENQNAIIRIISYILFGVMTLVRIITPIQRSIADIAIVLDISGSMDGTIERYKVNLIQTIQSLSDSVRVTFVVFDSHARQVTALVPMTQENKALLIESIRGIHTGGSTNLAAGIHLAHLAFAEAVLATDATMIILTDGAADPHCEASVRMPAFREAFPNANVTLVTIGGGISADVRNQMIVDGELYLHDHGGADMSGTIIDSLFNGNVIGTNLTITFGSHERSLHGPEFTTTNGVSTLATVRNNNVYSLFLPTQPTQANMNGNIDINVEQHTPETQDEVLRMIYNDRINRAKTGTPDEQIAALTAIRQELDDIEPRPNSYNEIVTTINDNITLVRPPVNMNQNDVNRIISRGVTNQRSITRSITSVER